MSRLSEALLEHLRRPQHVGPPPGPGELLQGEARNAACRDHVVLYLRRDAHGQVAAAGFRATGCPAAIGMASAASALLPGLLLDGDLPVALRARFVATHGEPAALHRHALELVGEALRLGGTGGR
jgi:NifU-like protein involved in Fe-S cluster formation